MSPHHHRLARRFAGVALLLAPLMGACAEQEPPAPPRRDYATGILTMEEVQRAMATNRRPTPPAAPVEAVDQHAPAKARVAAAPTTAPSGRAAARRTDAPPARRPAAVTVPAPAASTVAAAPLAPPALPSATMPQPQASTDAALSAAAPSPGVAAPGAPPSPASAEIYAHESPIYSSDDPDVVPAQLLTEQRNALPAASTTFDVNTMELVISKGGRVEQVKLAAPPKRMTDMLLLSGAKTWKFAPALKDGQPVRDRAQFSWATTR